MKALDWKTKSLGKKEIVNVNDDTQGILSAEKLRSNGKKFTDLKLCRK